MPADLLWYKVVKVVAGWTGAGAAFFGVGILCYQAVRWLKTDYWKPYTIVQALHDLGVPDLTTTQYLGLQKIIFTILLWPASFGYLTVAIVCGLISLRAAEAETKIEVEQDRLKQMAAGKPRIPR